MNQLPSNCAALFACGPGQQAYEHDEWKHGAFTRAFLDVCETRNEVTANELSALLYRRVNELIASKPGIDSKQTVSNVTRDLVDLKLERKPPASAVLPDSFANSLGAKMKLIPRGTFTMGNQRSIKEVNEKFPSQSFADIRHEYPKHKVTISKPFYMCEHEVTLGEFRKFVDATGYRTDAEKDDQGGVGSDKAGMFVQSREFNWNNTGFVQRDNHPVINVSWNDANAFCKWLSKQERREYRLPTEAEWEYACRAGSDSDFSFGDDPEKITDFANVGDASAKRRFTTWDTVAGDDGYVITAPVAHFQSNAFGLFDMHGNVSEWCHDAYAGYSSANASDPTGPASAESRVYRGGSWSSSPFYCRSTHRDRSWPDHRDHLVGFRVVSTSP